MQPLLDASPSRSFGFAYLIAGHTQNPVAEPAKKLFSLRIMDETSLRFVPSTIDVNDQAKLEVAEISCVGWDRVLATEFQSEHTTVAQPLPNRSCEFIGGAPLLTSEFNQGTGIAVILLQHGIGLLAPQ